jgi:hypothetical protein
MGEHQKETAFLKRIILYDDSDECRKLEERIAQVQHDARSVQRVASVTALFPLLAVVGVAYRMVFGESFPYPEVERVLWFLCELGLASLVCLAGLGGLLMAYRKKLNRLRNECRQLVIRLLESHLRQPQIPTLPSNHRVIVDHGALPVATEVSADAGSPSLT